MEEAEKKKEFINENIIKAGIALEEIKKYAEGNGKPFDSLNNEEIKDLIHKFKNKDKKEDTNNEELKIIKKENIKAKILVKENNVVKDVTGSKEPEIKNGKGEEKKDEPKQEIPPKEEKEQSKNQVPPQQKQEEKKENNVQMPNKEPNLNNNQAVNQPQPQPKNNLGQNPQQVQKIVLQKPIYSLESFNFKTSPQQNNKLLEFAQNKKNFQIAVTESKKESEGGFFSKAIFSYRVECPELGSDVRRTYADFEWLRNQLNKRYPLRLTPVIPKENSVKQVGKNLRNENEESFELRKIRYLNRFLESILKKKILATSPILYEFLVLDNENFIKYKNFLDKKQYELDIGLNNLITIKGEVKCALENNTINDSEIIINKSMSLADLYNRITANIEQITNNLNGLSQHFKEISVLFSFLYNNLTAYKYTNVDDMKSSFNDLKILFEKWSENTNSQIEFFNNIIKENLNYMSLELTEVGQIFKRYRDYRFEYEDYTNIVREEKEDLINSRIQEEMKKEENKGKVTNQIKINKKRFDELFKNKNILLDEEKKRLCTMMHYLIKDYNKLIAIHSKKIKTINELTKKNIVIDFIKE